MKRFFLKLNSLVTAMVFSVIFGISTFAAGDTPDIPLTPTITPLRIFFAVLVIILFVVCEILFEKIREKRIEKRNNSCKNDK